MKSPVQTRSLRRRAQLQSQTELSALDNVAVPHGIQSVSETTDSNYAYNSGPQDESNSAPISEESTAVLNGSRIPTSPLVHSKEHMPTFDSTPASAETIVELTKSEIVATHLIANNEQIPEDDSTQRHAVSAIVGVVVVESEINQQATLHSLLTEKIEIHTGDNPHLPFVKALVMGTPLADFLPEQYTQPLLEKTLDAFLARSSPVNFPMHGLQDSPLASLPTAQLGVYTNISEEVPIVYRTESKTDISNCVNALSTQVRSTSALRRTTGNGNLSSTSKRHNTYSSSTTAQPLDHFDGDWTDSFIDNPNGRMRPFPRPKQEADCKTSEIFLDKVYICTSSDNNTVSSPIDLTRDIYGDEEPLIQKKDNGMFQDLTIDLDDELLIEQKPYSKKRVCRTGSSTRIAKKIFPIYKQSESLWLNETKTSNNSLRQRLLSSIDLIENTEVKILRIIEEHKSCFDKLKARIHAVVDLVDESTAYLEECGAEDQKITDQISSAHDGME